MGIGRGKKLVGWVTDYSEYSEGDRAHDQALANSPFGWDEVEPAEPPRADLEFYRLAFRRLSTKRDHHPAMFQGTSLGMIPKPIQNHEIDRYFFVRAQGRCTTAYGTFCTLIDEMDNAFRQMEIRKVNERIKNISSRSRRPRRN